MSSRVVFGGGLLVGSLVGALGCRMSDRSKGNQGQGRIHVEFQEEATAQRCTDMTKYGAPVRSPDVSCYTNHSLCYDQTLKIPHWVAEHMTAENIKGNANRRNVKFRSDPNLPTMFSAQNSDYLKSGWSRGHMSPAGDNKISQDAMKDTFYLSNIVPQNYQNNSGFWNRFEMYCRDLTKVYANVYVLTGPLMMPYVDTDQKTYIKYEVIGENLVAAPTHLYKVIVADTGNINDPPALGAFIVPNIPISFDHQLPEYQVPLEKVEKHSGFSFVPKLDRTNTRNLCDATGCKLITKDAFQLYIINSKMKRANTPEKLEKHWNEIKDGGLTPDDYSQNVYNTKKQEFKESPQQGG